MKCCGVEELPGKPGLQNKQQPAEQSLFSSGVTFLEPNLHPASLCKPGVERNFKKSLSHFPDIDPDVSRCDSVYQVPHSENLKMMKGLVLALVCTCWVGHLKPMPVQGAGAVASNVPLHPNWMCLYTFFLIAGNFFFFYKPLRLTSSDQFKAGN